jgi:hypothetical protein
VAPSPLSRPAANLSRSSPLPPRTVAEENLPPLSGETACWRCGAPFSPAGATYADAGRGGAKGFSSEPRPRWRALAGGSIPRLPRRSRPFGRLGMSPPTDAPNGVGADAPVRPRGAGSPPFLGETSIWPCQMALVGGGVLSPLSHVWERDRHSAKPNAAGEGSQKNGRDSSAPAVFRLKDRSLSQLFCPTSFSPAYLSPLGVAPPPVQLCFLHRHSAGLFPVPLGYCHPYR